MVKRRKFSAEYKARLVLELLSGQRSAADIARKEHVKDALLYEWRAQFLERAAVVFSEPAANHESEQKVAELEQLIGQLTIENEVLKKASRWLQRMSRRSD
jgi:transposase